MIKSDIIFTGFYGQLNTGDDAFVEVASWGAKNIWKKERCRFLAKTDKLPKTIIPAKGYPLSIPKSYGLQANFLLDNTDSLIFAGGSTIHSKMSVNSVRMKALQKKVAGCKMKIGGIGVSIGPFKSSEDQNAVESYLKQMDFLAVRDQMSFDYVSTLDLPYQPINAFDLAALLPEIYNYEKSHISYDGKKIVGISVCPYESVQKGLDVTKEERRNKMLVDLLTQIDKEGNVHFKFYIINGSDVIGDKKLTMETIDKVLPNSYEIVDYSSSTQTIWESIANCDFMISTRLHAAIFACFAYTPFMLNEYHRKCSDFLDNIAYNEEYRLFDSEYDVKEKAGQILDILYHKNIYRLPSRVETMKERAKLNFTKINL
jgi:polysaccharide pyruvyl transferase WcaK-like protein